MYGMGFSKFIGVVLLVCLVFLSFNPFVMGFNVRGNGLVFRDDVNGFGYFSHDENVSVLVEVNDLIVKVGSIIDRVRNLVVSARVARVSGVESVERMLDNATSLYLLGVNLFLSKDYNGSVYYLREANVVASDAWNAGISLVYGYLSVRLDADVSLVNVLSVWVLNASNVVSGVNFSSYVSGLGLVRGYFDRAVEEFRLYSPVNRSTSDHLASALLYYAYGRSVLNGLVVVLSDYVGNFVNGLRYNASVVLSGFELEVRRVSEYGIMVPDNVSLLLGRAREEFSLGDRAYSGVNGSDVGSWGGYLTAIINYRLVVGDVYRADLLLREHLRGVAVGIIEDASRSLTRMYNIPGASINDLNGVRVRLNDLSRSLGSAVSVDDLLDIINRARFELNAINVVRGALESLTDAYNVPGVSVNDLNDVRVRLNGLQKALGSAMSVDDLVGVIDEGRVIKSDIGYIVSQAKSTVTSDVTNVVMSLLVVFVVVSFVFGLVMVNRRSVKVKG